MSVRNLDAVFRPHSIALVGASTHTATVGGVLSRNLVRAGFKGRIMPVNPHYDTILDLPVFPDVAHLPETPDLAVIATPPETVPGLLRELGARGTRGAVVISAGFAELGERGRALQKEALEAAEPHLMRLVGPNCVGVMVPAVGLDASFSHIAPMSGDLAFVSQSGALITAVLDWAAPRGIGFSHVVSLGDTADVDFGDMLDYLAADPGTRAILLYVEGLTHARKFMSAARAAARAKPVLAVKVGRFAESARAARSHTGALAGSDAVYEAAFRRAGMLRVASMSELFDAVQTLAMTGPQQGDRLVILTNGGGPGVLATDSVVELGGRLAQLSPETTQRLDAVLPKTWSRGNPVDIIGDADGARYGAAVDILLSAPEIDALLVMNCPTALTSAEDAAKAVIASVAKLPHAQLFGRNLITAWLGEATAESARQHFAAARIATYATPDAAVRGFMHRVQYRRNQDLLMETPPLQGEGVECDAARAEAAFVQALAAGREWLDAVEVADVLAAYGIPCPAYRLATDPADAARQASAIGGKVALKIHSPDITHKSDVGGVALGLAGPRAVETAAAAMLERVRGARPDARLDGFLVQQMIERPDAIELILGVNEDANFGPIILFGQGGKLVEYLSDTTLELPPLNAAIARAQIARTRVARLLAGFRGTPAARIEAVIDAMLRVSRLASEQPMLKELDLNPLLADKDGVVAVDARIRVQKVRTAPLAIRPYPKELEHDAVLRDGTAIHLRPVRPEDEPLLQDLAHHMSAEDLRLRFFVPMKELSHRLAARLSQLDYDRELALIALPRDGGAALGVVRYGADPDNRSAEYALGVRSDRQGHGLGTLLMQEIIAAARSRGIGEIVGEVLHENNRMLQICAELGFTKAAHPEDPSLVRVTKRLA
ncbi:MAG TPA: bifunctional acetate--CoA ligase family protein/GNAT family N-acetyltransferase [Stellaceae bacterium]|nr:bifunctional acetate--CoA ligase family protein/GNAT family N-acetyltransferase [Stellaceae bacterium]